MTGPIQPPNPGGSDPDDASPAVAGLARELHELRRTITPLCGLPGRVEEIAKLLTDLAGTVEAMSARKGPTPAPSWLMAPTSPADVAELLAGLIEWMRVIYLRYIDAAAGLPACWLWHPDIVEELLWLQHAWLAAYQGGAASVGLVGDWHDRYRPGVVARVKAYGRACSWEQHSPRAGRAARVGPPMVAAGEHADTIATWWATARDEPAPRPPATARPAGSPRIA